MVREHSAAVYAAAIIALIFGWCITTVTLPTTELYIIICRSMSMRERDVSIIITVQSQISFNFTDV